MQRKGQKIERVLLLLLLQSLLLRMRPPPPNQPQTHSHRKSVQRCEGRSREWRHRPPTKEKNHWRLPVKSEVKNGLHPSQRHWNTRRNRRNSARNTNWNEQECEDDAGISPVRPVGVRPPADRNLLRRRILQVTECPCWPVRVPPAEQRSQIDWEVYSVKHSEDESRPERRRQRPHEVKCDCQNPLRRR